MRVGDYVRSSWGTISKITEYTPYEDDECFGVKFEDGYSTFYKNQWQFDNDYKSSPNIIDLIEVGDYINGMLVTNIWIDKETSNIEFEFNNHESYLYPKSWNYESRVTKYKIKSIVTKEQFEQMEYRMGD